MVYPQVFRAISIVSIAANALTAGSLFTYPIFSSSLQSKLNFSIQQISTTASIAILCQYLSAGFWGYLADKSGPGRLSLAAGVLFFLGYGTLSYLLLGPSTHNAHNIHHLIQPSTLQNWIYATLAYSLCGIATTASYFSAIVASAKMFASQNPGLSVAGPSSLAASSPFILSLIGIKCFSDSEEGFNSSGYLIFLAILALIVNSIGSVSLQSKDELEFSTADSEPPGERSPLIQSSTPHSSPHLKPITTLQGEPDSVINFLSSPSVWLLGMAILMSCGPAEMTIASIGAVADSKQPGLGTDFRANQVQLISISNTIARLLAGWLSDRFCQSNPISNLAAWATASLFYSITCFSITFKFGAVWVLSLFTGSCYGIIFTLVPSLLATVWPLECFGRNYGIMSYFFATGSFLMTFLFGTLYKTEDSNSISLIYHLSGFLELVAILLMAFLYLKYWKNVHFNS